MSTVWVGTAAHGMWYSKDLGETWHRPTSRAGLYLEAGIFSFAHHPSEPGYLLAGTTLGINRWIDSEERWEHLESPMDEPGCSIWSLVKAQHDPDILIAGTRPSEFFCSDDGGKSWRSMYIPMEDAAESATRASRGYSGRRFMRVTRMIFDPADVNTIWAAIEIDAIYRSRDNGHTWERLSQGLISEDIHDLAIFDLDGGRRMFAPTNKGLHRSDDGGESWRHIELDSPWQYTRTITPRLDMSGVVFLTNGNGPPGNSGRLLRSRDWGDTWEEAELPGERNSTVWKVATNPADPQLLFTCTNLGQLFRSTDGGESWTRLERELGDVRAMTWTPW